ITAGPSGTPRGTAPCDLLGVAEADDLDEVVGLEAGTADQGTVDIVLTHDAAGVVALDRTAVEQTHGPGDLGRVELGQAGADRRADLLSVLGGGDLAGTDGPDGLVGDDELLGLLGGDALQRAVDLAQDVLDLVAGLAHLQA